MNVMDNTVGKIETQIPILPSLLKKFEMFKMRLWYDNENLEENVVDSMGLSVVPASMTP